MIFGFVGRIGHGKTMRGSVFSIELAQLRGAVLASNITLRPGPSTEFRKLPMDGFSDALEELVDELTSCGSCAPIAAGRPVVDVDEYLSPVGALNRFLGRPPELPELPFLDAGGELWHGSPECEQRGLVLFVDEVDTIWDAHEWQSFSKLDRFRIKQSRKQGVDVVWTAQFVDQVEKSLRNITEEVSLMRAFPPPTLARYERGARPWLLYASRFRPGAVRELTAAQDPDRRLGRKLHRYRRIHERLYNTRELIRPPAPADTSAIADCPRCLRAHVKHLIEPCPDPAAHTAPPRPSLLVS